MRETPGSCMRRSMLVRLRRERAGGQVRLEPRILPGGQMSSQVQVQVLSSVCHGDMQELSFTVSSQMSGYLWNLKAHFVLFFTHGVDVLKDVTILQSLSESQKWLLTCLKEVHPP